MLGSRREAERFDQMSDAEAQEQLAKLAQQHDVNKDGYIDSKELRKWIVERYRFRTCFMHHFVHLQF